MVSNHSRQVFSRTWMISRCFSVPGGEFARDETSIVTETYGLYYL